jgi:hypothetical protein
MPSLPPREVMTGVDEQPPRPRLEALAVAEPWQLPPGVDEGILDGVLRVVRVVQDEAGDGMEPIEPIVDEAGEGVMVAGHRPLHQDLPGWEVDQRGHPGRTPIVLAMLRVGARATTDRR